MNKEPSRNQPNFLPPPMQPPSNWEPPAILLERSLVIHAQEGITGPDGMPMGWIGPLNGSGMDGLCG